MTTPTSETNFDLVVIGGGIVGLATAYRIREQFNDLAIAVVEKESKPALHQTGRNSGVIHSGIYYPPGSLKAELCRRGAAEMIDFCKENEINHRVAGKIIVATERHEFDRLERLAEQAATHGLPVESLDRAGIGEVEPHAAGLRALHVPSTGIVDYAEVSRVLSELLERSRVAMKFDTEVTAIEANTSGYRLMTTRGELSASFVINCAGLHSDRVAKFAGQRPPARIIPFRGEYYELAPDAHNLVSGLIYPVPDPSFPFLGVHLTSMIGGGVHAGPNAVLAFKREGYKKLSFSARDSWDALTYPGLLRLAVRNLRPGAHEVARSLSKRLFTRSLQRLIPDVQRADLKPSPPGVRAQALKPSGELVDDFLIVADDRSLHVCNAPSPAATASLAIGTEISERFARLRR